MLPSYYDYHNPVKIVSGNNALENLPSELTRLRVDRPLVLTDKDVTRSGGVTVFKKGFADSGIILGAIVDDVPAPASQKAVEAIVKVFRLNRCNGIIAVGGRSVIDTAKGVAILASQGSDDILAFAGIEMINNPLIPLVVVPTSSGSGAEVSRTAFIGHQEKNVNLVYTSHYLVPVMAVLDPRMILVQPSLDTAAAGMYALANAMEAMTCVGKNPMSDAVAFAAIDLIRQSMIKAVQGVDEPGVRLAMANASVMAGAASSNSMGGVVHALAQSIGHIAGVSWGIAMAIVLPFGLEFNLNVCESTLGALLLPLAGADEFARTPESRRATRLIESVKELLKTMNDLSGLPLTLAGAGVPRHTLETIAHLAVNDPALIMNPRSMTVPQALDILNQAYA